MSVSTQLPGRTSPYPLHDVNRTIVGRMADATAGTAVPNAGVTIIPTVPAGQVAIIKSIRFACQSRLDTFTADAVDDSLMFEVREPDGTPMSLLPFLVPGGRSVITSGTAAASLVTTIVKTGALWTASAYVGKFGTVTSGALQGVGFSITANTADTLTITPAFSEVPDGMTFEVYDDTPTMYRVEWTPQEGCAYIPEGCSLFAYMTDGSADMDTSALPAVTCAYVPAQVARDLYGITISQFTAAEIDATSHQYAVTSWGSGGAYCNGARPTDTTLTAIVPAIAGKHFRIKGYNVRAKAVGTARNVRILFYDGVNAGSKYTVQKFYAKDKFNGRITEQQFDNMNVTGPRGCGVYMETSNAEMGCTIIVYGEYVDDANTFDPRGLHEESGLVTTGGVLTTFSDSKKAWKVNEFQGRVVYIGYGTGAGSFRTVATNTATEITLTANLTTDTTSNYTILAGIQTGTADASAATTLEDATRNWIPDELIGRTVVLTGGVGVGQQRVILDNDANTLTVGTWDGGISPDTSTTYAILDKKRGEYWWCHAEGTAVNQPFFGIVDDEADRIIIDGFSICHQITATGDRAALTYLAGTNYPTALYNIAEGCIASTVNNSIISTCDAGEVTYGSDKVGLPVLNLSRPGFASVTAGTFSGLAWGRRLNSKGFSDGLTTMVYKAAT